MAEAATELPDRAEVEAFLARVRDGLDEDLSLAAAAGASGTSTFQFHRRFRKATGETPRRYVERMRLERAAYLLAVTETRVVEIAMAVGFESHEAFARAFRRWFGRSPSALRREARAWQGARMERSRGFAGDGCRFSQPWFEPRPPTHVLAVRRRGPYADLNQAAARQPSFQEIEAWALAHGVRLGDARWGLFPDDPTRTPPHLQCAELCVPVHGPAPGGDRVRCLELAGGLYGKIVHFGPGPTLLQGYRQLADAIRRAGHGFREDPPIQVFFPGDDERFEIWFPVQRR